MFTYGDLSTSVAFANFGFSYQNEKILALAKMTCRTALSRTVELLNIKDIHLCHGLAGVAEIASFVLQDGGSSNEHDILNLNSTLLRLIRGNLDSSVPSDLLEGISGVGLHLIGDHARSRVWKSLFFL